MPKVPWYNNFDKEFDQKNLREWRCSNPNCRALLAMEYVHSGNIAIKCQGTDKVTKKTCGELNRLMFRSLAHSDTITTATPAGGTKNNK